MEGGSYTGELRDGKQHGKGKYTWIDKSRFFDLGFRCSRWSGWYGSGRRSERVE